MKHVYLSELLIDEALKHNQITMQEAQKLRKRLIANNQSISLLISNFLLGGSPPSIFKTLTKYFNLIPS